MKYAASKPGNMATDQDADLPRHPVRFINGPLHGVVRRFLWDVIASGVFHHKADGGHYVYKIERTADGYGGVARMVRDDALLVDLEATYSADRLKRREAMMAMREKQMKAGAERCAEGYVAFKREAELKAISDAARYQRRKDQAETLDIMRVVLKGWASAA